MDLRMAWRPGDEPRAEAREAGGMAREDPTSTLHEVSASALFAA